MVETHNKPINVKENLVTMSVHCSYGCGRLFVGKYRPGSQSEQRVISRALQLDKITHEIDCKMNPKNIRGPV